VALDARGFIAVDDELRTSADGIWALGDVNGRGAFTHTSFNDHEIVAANLLDGDVRRMSDRIPAYALFTDPPLGRVGMTEAEARATGRPALKGFLPMARVGCARERGETRGFLKVLIDRESKLILGAALLCVEGRRDRALTARRHGREGAVHGRPAQRTHPPDGQQADPDHAWQFGAAGLSVPAARHT
jgi:pyruvate/2-oxoglutarate dehydrogenase complex dihydrolipoamide dehydrogenase (E3) component